MQLRGEINYFSLDSNYVGGVTGGAKHPSILVFIYNVGREDRTTQINFCHIIRHNSPLVLTHIFW